MDLKVYAIIRAYIYSSYTIFSLGTDDDHRVVLKSISDGVDCEHDYINATYIDVRNMIQKFDW